MKDILNHFKVSVNVLISAAEPKGFGPNAENTEGRILGSIIMLVGIGITLVSTLMQG